VNQTSPSLNSPGGRQRVFISTTGAAEQLRAELQGAGAATSDLGQGLLIQQGEWVRIPTLAACRQILPDAVPWSADSVNAWARNLFDTAVNWLPEVRPWQLTISSHYGGGEEVRIGARAVHTEMIRRQSGGASPCRRTDRQAGENRCQLIRAAVTALLRDKRRHLLRQLRSNPTPFTPEDSLVQLLLTSPTTGWLSVSVAPEPFRLRQWISPFPKGEIPVAVDKAAPSRAFAKLVEAELRFGRRIAPGETCVDLGASPGGWTWVARQRGAQVIAVDRSPLRDDLMADPAVTFVRGDAFNYQPDRPVDWLVCDVIAAPERSIELVLEWVRRRWARHFVVTIKLREGDHPKLDRLKQEMPAFSDDWFLTHLCANKHEACVFGSVRPEGNAIAVAGSATA
jgi:23S rRNA (cytidine2498-2'-O)-methyltransferase